MTAARPERPLEFCYRVTKYDTADRDENGYYVGDLDVESDHGPVEAAYLDAVTAFASEAGVTLFSVREPGVTGFVNFGVEPVIDGQGLIGLFVDPGKDFHDGAMVSVEVARELVRAMLRDNGAWCRLERFGRLHVHIGYDQYLYITSCMPSEYAIKVAHNLGLFVERIPKSPYAWTPDEPPARPADDAFWQEVAALIADRGPLLLEEGPVRGRSTWRRLTVDRLVQVRRSLVPRARLLLWPDLSTDVAALMKRRPKDIVQIVWENEKGVISDRQVDRASFRAFRAEITDARAVRIASMLLDEADPAIMTGVLPDPDGVLRARWTP